MTTSTLLCPLKCVGYALPTPPRSGSWLIDRRVSFVELRLRELHRTSVLEAPLQDGEVSLADTASVSGIQLQLGAAVTRRGSRRAGKWLRAAGLDSVDQLLRFDSRLLLASPHGWRMCGRLRGARLDAMLVADARLHDIHTQADGHDAMVVTANGSVERSRTPELNDILLGSRVAVRIHAYVVHDWIDS
jgi:hypothetical protein